MTRLGLVFFLAIVVCVSARDWEYGKNCLYNWAGNCEFEMNDSEVKISLPEDCALLCLTNIECSHFTWSMQKGCAMKYSPVALQDSDSVGSTCGFIIDRTQQVQ